METTEMLGCVKYEAEARKKVLCQQTEAATASHRITMILFGHKVDPTKTSSPSTAELFKGVLEDAIRRGDPDDVSMLLAYAIEEDTSLRYQLDKNYIERLLTIALWEDGSYVSLAPILAVVVAHVVLNTTVLNGIIDNMISFVENTTRSLTNKESALKCLMSYKSS